MSEKTKVSVAIATYNGEKFIEQQLRSILSQIHAEDEVIVSDDHSTDHTVEIIQRINDPRIQLIFNECRKGTCGNFENALRHVRGDIIFLADQDDVWLPGKYNIMTNALKNYDLVHSDSIVTDESLHQTHDSLYAFYHNGPGLLKNIIHHTYFGSHMAFNRTVLTTCFPFPQTDEVGHDTWIGIIAETIGNVCFINDKLLLYRRHADAHNGYFERSHRKLFTKIFSRIQFMYYYLEFRKRYKHNGKHKQ